VQDFIFGDKKAANIQVYGARIVHISTQGSRNLYGDQHKSTCICTRIISKS